ncbi:hypothetical protein HDV03_004285 [Kappamyces sp. JEL0829]|nr:hypothetical protein HDV03_004285 [Kappamyces sp. JEL0829]
MSLTPQIKTILSGIQPTGIPHLGNYLGAIQSWVQLQSQASDHRVLLSVVDLHALTMPQHPATLRKATVEMGAALLACGIDPQAATLFRQSRIAAHAELGWILFCRTPISWLTRMHQWKTKSGDETDGRIGLLSYPVLQAADILLYNTTHVPVGEDQSQHINLTTDIAKSFNSHYQKPVFVIPQGSYGNLGSRRIMSLRNPLKKMSKSDGVETARIDVTDPPGVIASKLRKAVTDSGPAGIAYDKLRPGIMNLLHILMAMEDLLRHNNFRWADLADDEIKSRVGERFGALNNTEFKGLVTERVVEHLEPIRTRFESLGRDPQPIIDAFRLGEEKAAAIANETLARVYETVGLR